MRKLDLIKMTIDQLLEQFVEIGLAEDAALDDDNVGKYNRLFDGIVAISKELKSRGHDARLALTKLYTHPNPQVRMQAAQFSYGVNPEAARAILQAIADSKMPPQYLDAGMSIAALDNGTSMLD
jgi:hypothetical protein